MKKFLWQYLILYKISNNWREVLNFVIITQSWSPSNDGIRGFNQSFFEIIANKILPSKLQGCCNSTPRVLSNYCTFACSTFYHGPPSPQLLWTWATSGGCCLQIAGRARECSLINTMVASLTERSDGPENYCYYPWFGQLDEPINTVFKDKGVVVILR